MNDVATKRKQHPEHADRNILMVKGETIKYKISTSRGQGLFKVHKDFQFKGVSPAIYMFSNIS